MTNLLKHHFSMESIYLGERATERQGNMGDRSHAHRPRGSQVLPHVVRPELAANLVRRGRGESLLDPWPHTLAQQFCTVATCKSLGGNQSMTNQDFFS